MADAVTTILGFVLPEVGASSDTWGSKLNTNFSFIDWVFGNHATSGSADAYTLTSGFTIASYVSGATLKIKPNFTNTGAVTFNLDGLGTKAITKNGTTALAANDLVSGNVYTISYDGTRWQLIGTTGTGVYQPLDATLTALAALAWSSGSQVPTFTASDTVSLTSIGTSGAVIPLLNGNNTQSGAQTFSGLVDFSRAAASNLQRWLNSTTTHRIDIIWDAGGLVANMRPAPSGSADNTKDFAYDFTNGRWVFDTTPYVSTAPIRVAGKTMVPIPASAMVANTTNGAAPATTETATNDVMVRTLDFDQTTQEGAQFLVPMPKGWNEGTVTFVPIWTAAAGSASETVVWSLRAQAFSDDDALDGAWGTEQTSSDALIATGDNHIGPESAAITIAGTPAEGDLVAFQVRRNVASDNLAADARLIAIRLFITTDAANDV